MLIDFDLDGDLDLSYGYKTSYYFKNEEGVYERVDIDNQGPEVWLLVILTTMAIQIY